MGAIAYKGQIYPTGASEASGSSYDNSSSGLNARNVQDAIDDLANIETFPITPVSSISDASPFTAYGIYIPSKELVYLNLSLYSAGRKIPGPNITFATIPSKYGVSGRQNLGMMPVATDYANVNKIEGVYLNGNELRFSNGWTGTYVQILALEAWYKRNETT